MSWAKLDDRFPRHRRVRRLRRDVCSKWLHVVAICFCCEHLTDGMIDELDLAQIVEAADIPKSAAERSVPRLVAAGLWEETPDGYAIRDFLDYNPASEKVRGDRAAAKERMRRLRAVESAVERSLREAS